MVGIGTFFVFLLIVLVVFLLLREVNCWYFKINQIINILQKTSDDINRLTNHLAGDNKNNTRSEDEVDAEFEKFFKQ